MNPIDQVLLRALITRNLDDLAPVREYLPGEFVSDLRRLFTEQGADPNRWFALARGLWDASLLDAANRAFFEALLLLRLAQERAKVYVHWAELEDAAGRVNSATEHLCMALRCDRSLQDVAGKLEERRRSLPRVMVAQWDVFGELNDPAEFRRVAPDGLFPAIAADTCRGPQSRAWSQMNMAARATAGDIDLMSFVVSKAAKPVLRVDCSIRGDSAIRCYEVPVLFAPARDSDDDDLPMAYDLAFQYLVDAARYVGSKRIHIEDEDVRVLTPIGIFASNRVSERKIVRKAYIDLRQEEREIWKGVRKGHRHAVNWGRKALELRHWSGEEDALFADFIDLYDRSGRARTFRTAADVAPFWAGDNGELTLAYLDGQAVGSVVVTYEGENAYYAVSVSVEHGEIAPSHWPLYHAILRARERGVKTFDFGYLETDPTSEEKMQAIAHFKSGFTKQYENKIWWLTDREPDSAATPTNANGIDALGSVAP